MQQFVAFGNDLSATVQRALSIANSADVVSIIIHNVKPSFHRLPKLWFQGLCPLLPPARSTKGLCDLSWCPYICGYVPTKTLKCSQNTFFSSLTVPLLHEMIIADVASLPSLPDLFADRPARTFAATYLQLRLRPPRPLYTGLRLLNYYYF